jgi:hypothetical protein
MWLTGRLAPALKTIADFRHGNGVAIRNVRWRFVELCRGLQLLSSDMAAIDGSRFKAANSRDENYPAEDLAVTGDDVHADKDLLRIIFEILETFRSHRRLILEDIDRGQPRLRALC